MKNMQATLNQISALLPIPMHLQVKGMQVFQKVKQRVTQAQPFPDFVETPIPDVATLKLEDIDMSNPFYIDSINGSRILSGYATSAPYTTKKAVHSVRFGRLPVMTILCSWTNPMSYFRRSR